MKKIAWWIINNVPCGKLAPILFTYAIVSKRYERIYTSTSEQTQDGRKEVEGG